MLEDVGSWVERVGIVLGSSFRCSCGRTHDIPLESVYMGRGIAEQLITEIRRLVTNGKVMVVDDMTTKRIAADEVAMRLRAEGLHLREFMVRGPMVEEAYRLSLELEGFDLALAVGGGTVIDVCKLASKIAGTRFISYPTTLSHDGIASPTASLIGEDSLKHSIFCGPPVAVYFDLNVLENQPMRMISAGCADLIAKTVSLKDWELAKVMVGEYYCGLAANLVKDSLLSLLNSSEGGHVDIKTLCRSLLLSGIAMTLVGSSRPCSGSEHLIAHRLEVVKGSNALHGELVGIGTILMARYHEAENENWWKERTFSYESITSRMNSLGVPTKIYELGIDEKELIEAVVTARDLRPERFTILHMRPLDRDGARKLIEETVL